MKAIIKAALMLAIIILALSGCAAKDSNVQEGKGKEVLVQLNAMVEQNAKPKQMFDYLNQNVSQMNKESATEAVGILVKSLEQNEAIYSEQLYTGNFPDLMYQHFDTKFDYSRIESLKNKELRELLYEIYLGGFKIVDVEGAFTVVVDYNALRTFSEYVEEELNSYIEIMALRFNDPAAVDASIEIGSEELENRILDAEGYIKTYKNEERKEIVTSIYLGYLMVYMSGSDYSEVFDSDTGAMDPSMFKLFETAAAKHRDTIFGRVMNKYVALLKAEGLANTEKVNDFILHIDTVVNEELAKL